MTEQKNGVDKYISKISVVLIVTGIIGMVVLYGKVSAIEATQIMMKESLTRIEARLNK